MAGTFSRSYAAARAADGVIVHRASEYGMVGDGATDNASGFEALGDAMRADTVNRHLVEFEANGHYKTSYNRWLMHQRHVTVDFKGSTYQCISSSMYDMDVRPFNNDSISRNDGMNVTQAGTNVDFGYYFDEALIGDGKVTLTAEGDAAGLSIGARVILWGYDQQFGGYPPNLREFQYNRIIDIDGADVYLAKKLVNNFFEDWKETQRLTTGVYYGKPKMLPLTRLPVTATTGYRYADYIGIFNGRIEVNPNNEVENRGGILAQARVFTMQNVDTNCDLWPSETERWIARGCRFEHSTDLDKCTHWMEFRDCIFDPDCTPATGMNYGILKRCHFNWKAQLACRNVLVRNCTVTNAEGNQFGVISPRGLWGNDTFVVDGLEVDNTEGSLDHVINNIPAVTMTAAASHTSIVYLADDAAGQAAVKILREGWKVFRSDDDEQATVDKVLWTGTQWAVHLAGNSTAVTAEDQYYFYVTRRIDVSGVVVTGTSAATIRYERPSQMGTLDEAVTFENADAGP